MIQPRIMRTRKLFDSWLKNKRTIFCFLSEFVVFKDVIYWKRLCVA